MNQKRYRLHDIRKGYQMEFINPSFFSRYFTWKIRELRGKVIATGTATTKELMIKEMDAIVDKAEPCVIGGAKFFGEGKEVFDDDD